MSEHLNPWYWAITTKKLFRLIWGGYGYNDETCKQIEGLFETCQHTVDFYQMRSNTILDKGMANYFSKRAKEMGKLLDIYKTNYTFRKTWDGVW